MLDPLIVSSLRSVENELEAKGKLTSRERLKEYYALFRQRFGPERLRALDGPELLEVMHDHGRRDEGLVYWLEFKDDDEFPDIFGSIAGGSALKFGIYRRRETGAWMTGSPRQQRELSLDEAIAIARRHRDQLLRGAELIEQLPADAGDADYLALQEALDQEAPDVSDTAWGHKYFSLLFPDRLDDFHSPVFQRFHLIKLLQIPPAEPGRYVCAGRFIAGARELEMPVNRFTSLLNNRYGSPHWYWRVGTSDGSAPANHWAEMRDGGFVAIGWAELGNLSELTPDKAGKESVRSLLEQRFPGSPQQIGKATRQVFDFVRGASEGDLVLAAQGATILGIGRIVGPYAFEAGAIFPHRRPVEWLSTEEMKLPISIEGLRTTFTDVTAPENCVAVERQLLQGPGAPRPEPRAISLAQTPARSVVLTGTLGRIQSMLERKGQVILYGPPGTGKTYHALRAAKELAALSSFGRGFDALQENERRALEAGDEGQAPLVRLCAFHPSYGYEDFLEGFRPEAAAGQMRFTLRDGIFKTLCDEARRRPERRYYLIIDEINRGDLPRIFGELMTVLEKNKRGVPIRLAVSGQPFTVPANVFLIGTMNTADRSIALLDAALRRRFAFMELMPDYEVLESAHVGGIPLGPWLKSLNARIREHVGRDGRSLEVGHAYLLDGSKPVADFQAFARIVEEDIVPLLQEYCYENWEALERILGRRLVDSAEKRIRSELFVPSQRQALIQALLQIDEDLSASSEAIAAEAETEEEDDGDELGEDSAA